MAKILTDEQIKTAQVLRSQYVPFEKIAEQLGCKESTIRMCAYRGGWSQTVNRTEQAMGNLVMRKVSDRINGEIDVCIAGAIELAKEGLSGLRHKKTKTMRPKDLRDYAGALRELVQVQRQALGMSEKASTQVNIGIVDYGSVSQGGQPSSEAPADQAIDIE